MSKIDWTQLFALGFIVWVFVARLDRLGRQLHYASYRTRREMAELLGKSARADELKEEWYQDEKEQRKERRRELIGFIIISVVALAWWAKPTVAQAHAARVPANFVKNRKVWVYRYCDKSTSCHRTKRRWTPIQY